eukprot:3362260-Pyramimonas_sp.AAC.1
MARKVKVYRAIVVPKLMYNLEYVWALQADKDRLNAFHVQCLRKIRRIPCAYVSRVSNRSGTDGRARLEKISARATEDALQ